MLSYALRRLIIGVLVMFVVSGITFTLTNAAIDPARAIAGEGATSDDVEAIRKSYGFDRALAARYVAWLGQALQGDLGSSYRQRRPVVDVIMERLPVTLKLGGLALAFALVLSIPLAIAAALRPNSWIDRIALLFALFGQAMPTFWFALLGIVVFSVNLRWLPASGSGTTAHFILPAIALGYYAAPTLMRLMRAGMIDVLASDYIRTARAKGLGERAVLYRHALRNALIPIITLAALDLPYIFTGAVLVETIFSWPGMGRLYYQSAVERDYPLLMAVLIIGAAFIILSNLLADVLYAMLDPRVRYSE